MQNAAIAMKSFPLTSFTGFILITLLHSCSSPQVVIEDDNAVKSYLIANSFTCHDQSLLPEKLRTEGIFFELRFDSLSGTLSTSGAKHPDTSEFDYKLSSIYKNEREILMDIGNRTRMTLRRDGALVLHISEEMALRNESPSTLLFIPEPIVTNAPTTVLKEGEVEAKESLAQRFEKQRFEELLLGKPRSYVIERLGEPDETDSRNAGMKETGTRTDYEGARDLAESINGRQVTTYKYVFKDWFRYNDRVFEGSPDNLIHQTWLRFDADGRYVEKVVYKR